MASCYHDDCKGNPKFQCGCKGNMILICVSHLGDHCDEKTEKTHTISEYSPEISNSKILTNYFDFKKQQQTLIIEDFKHLSSQLMENINKDTKFILENSTEIETFNQKIYKNIILKENPPFDISAQTDLEKYLRTNDFFSHLSVDKEIEKFKRK